MCDLELYTHKEKVQTIFHEALCPFIVLDGKMKILNERFIEPAKDNNEKANNF